MIASSPHTGWGTLVGRVLGFLGRWVVKFLKGLGNVPWYMDVDMSEVVVPVQGKATEKFAFPVYRDIIVFL